MMNTRVEPTQPREWVSKGIMEMSHPLSKQPDLCNMEDMLQLVYHTSGIGKSDERPIIVDYESGSSGRVQRIMKWADDYVPGHESKKGCCLRFEVRVIKAGRRAHHQVGDTVIWSQTFNDIMCNESVLAALHANKVYAKEMRETLIRDGFPDQAKEI